ncbi:hypothetical protein [Trinickia fusca]|uniref:Uncharacterized protein n=1 Tax=Trinickia fusca TaxID=2419777 RepID=A0A494WY96_9BURK|nr:hypothetical protein [Trinickia fusca]RKP43518.1 hypothetical protein D7S89_25755 [Trinickia fusca]
MSFKQSVGVGAAGGLNLPDGSKAKAVWDALSKFLVPQPSTASTTNANTAQASNAATASTPTIDQATQFITELNALYSKLGGDGRLDYPGGQVTFVSGNSAGVTLDRKFEVPVVIGYRGIPITLDALDADSNDPVHLAFAKGQPPAVTPTASASLPTSYKKAVGSTTVSSK